MQIVGEERSRVVMCNDFGGVGNRGSAPQLVAHGQASRTAPEPHWARSRRRRACGQGTGSGAVTS